MKKLSTFFATLLVSVLLIGSTSFAQITWTAGNTTTNWNTPSNWSGNTVPTAADNVIIPNIATQPVLDGAAVCKGLTIDAGATLSMGTFSLTASGAVTISGTLSAASGNAAAFTVNAGGINILSGGTLNALNIPTIEIKAGNWTNSGTFVLGSPTNVKFSGSSAQTINSATTFYDLTTTNSVRLSTGNNNLIITGQLNASGGFFNAGSSTITIAGSNPNPLLVGTGTFTASTSTVSFQGNAAATIPAATFYNLDINKTGTTFKAANGVVVEGNLSITSGTFDIFSLGTVTVSVAGNFTNAGSFKATGAGTMNFNGDADQSIAGVAYNNLVIASDGVVSLANTASVTNLSITGTFSDAGFQLNGSAAGTLAMASGSKLTLGATAATTFPYAGVTVLGSGTTVEYASSSAQTIADQVTYDNLVLSGTGTKTVNGSFTTKNFTNTSTLNDNKKTITVTGWWVGANGTYSAGTGKVVFAGVAAQTVDGSAFNNLTVNTGGTGLAPSATITVNKDFVLGGKFVTGARSHIFKGN